MSISIKIKKSYPDFCLNIDFESSSRRIGILGGSGSGKSLTLKCISGIVKADDGIISADGRELFNSEKRVNLKPRQRKTGYLFQNYALFPTMSVKENIMCVLRGSKVQKEEIAELMLEKFNLTGLENHLPSQLSGGQQQRCALARIMACEPDIILLDEPFSALDAAMRDEVMGELISMLFDYEGIIITVSHNRDEIYALSDEVIILDKGSVVSKGSKSKVFLNPINAASARLTGHKNAAAAIIKDKRIYIEDWNLYLDINADIKAVSIPHDRFHLKSRGKAELCFEIYDMVSAELQNCYNIYFRPHKDSKKRLVCTIPKERWTGNIKRLYVYNEDISFFY